jgi:PEP-CTERM motif
MLHYRGMFAAGLYLLTGLSPSLTLAETSVYAQASASGFNADVIVQYYSPVGLSAQTFGSLGGSTTTYSPASAPIGLTAITLTAAVTGIHSGSSMVSADLSTGFVKAIATSDNGSVGKGLAELNDDVTFTVAGGGSKQITVISHLDGAIGAFANSFSFSGLSFILNFNTSGMDSNLIYTSQGSQGGFVFSVRGASSLTPDGWDSYTLSNVTATGFDFVGLLTISDGEIRRVRQQLFLNCQEGVSCDFSHTGSIALQLPSGVSFTSGSGVFLNPPTTSAVPEPTSWTMLVAGFGLVGGVARRRHAGRGWQFQMIRKASA